MLSYMGKFLLLPLLPLPLLLLLLLLFLLLVRIEPIGWDLDLEGSWPPGRDFEF